MGIDEERGEREQATSWSWSRSRCLHIDGALKWHISKAIQDCLLLLMKPMS